MRKITLLMITLIISMSLVNADETTTSTTNTTSTETGTTADTSTGTETDTTASTATGTVIEDSNEDAEEDVEENTEDDSSDNADNSLNNKKEEFKKLKEQEKMKIEANRDKMKENRVNFKAERATGSVKKPMLTEETKAQIKVIMDAHKVSADSIRTSVASGSLTKEEGLKQLEELKMTTSESLKALVWNNEDAMKNLWVKKDMLDKNMEIRKENGEIRKDFRQQKHDLKVKYKAKFVKALGTKLDNFSEERLNTILAKINVAMEKTLANNKLSQINKDKIIAQLDALKAIINEKLWVSEEEQTPEINVDELISE